MTYTFKVFISYSTSPDFRVARDLELYLEFFDQLPIHGEAAVLKIEACRDGSDFRLGKAKKRGNADAVWTKIEGYLEQSEYLLVLGSRNGAASIWMEREAAWFLKNRPDKILLAVTEGDPLAAPEEIFPPSIVSSDILRDQIWYDFREKRSRGAKDEKLRPFEDEQLRLAADLSDLSFGTIKQLWSDQQKKAATLRFRIISGVSGVLALLLLLSVYFGYNAWKNEIAERAARHQAVYSLAKSHFSSGLLVENEARRDAVAHFARVVDLVPDYPGGLAKLNWLLRTTDFPRLALPPIHRSDLISSLDFSEEGTELLISSRDGAFSLIDLTTGQEKWSVNLGSELDAFLVDDEDTVVVFQRTGKISLYSRIIGEQIGEALQLSGSMHWLSTPPNRPRDAEFAVLCDDTVRWVKVRSHGLELVNEVTHGSKVSTAILSKDGTYLATGCEFGKIKIWKPDSQQPVTTIDTISDWPVNRIDFDPEVRFVGAACGKMERSINTDSGGESHTEGGVRVWTIEGEPLIGWGGNKIAQVDFRFSPNGSMVLTSGMDGVVKVYRTSDFAFLFDIPHYADVRHAYFSQDGRFIVTASIDGMARLTNCFTGERAVIPVQHKIGLGPIDYCPRKRLMATSSLSGEVYVSETIMSAPDLSLWKIGGTGETRAIEGESAETKVEGQRRWLSDGVQKSIVRIKSSGSNYEAIADPTSRIISLKKNGESIGNIPFETAVEKLQLSPTGRYLAVFDRTYDLTLYRLTGLTKLWRVENALASSTAKFLVFSGDESTLAIGSILAEWQCIEVQTGTSLTGVSYFPDASLMDEAALSRTGDTLVIKAKAPAWVSGFSIHDGGIPLWGPVETNRKISIIEVTDSGQSLIDIDGQETLIPELLIPADQPDALSKLAEILAGKQISDISVKPEWAVTPWNSSVRKSLPLSGWFANPQSGTILQEGEEKFNHWLYFYALNRPPRETLYRVQRSSLFHPDCLAVCALAAHSADESQTSNWLELAARVEKRISPSGLEILSRAHLNHSNLGDAKRVIKTLADSKYNPETLKLLEKALQRKEYQKTIESPPELEVPGFLWGEGYVSIVRPPSGWVLDNHSAHSQGIHACFYPAGESWNDAPVKAYINVEGGVSPSLSQRVEQFQKQVSGTPGAALDILSHSQGQTQEGFPWYKVKYRQTASSITVFELVYYQSFQKNEVTIVMRAVDEALIDKNTAAFESLIDRFEMVTESPSPQMIQAFKEGDPSAFFQEN